MNQAMLSNGEKRAEAEFQEKMKQRMRAAMGDLMPDAVLAGIVARGIDEAFFKKQRRPGNGYGHRDEEYPPWLVQYVEKEADKQVQAAVERWVAENREKFAAIVERQVARGFAASAVRAFDLLLQQTSQSFQEQVRDVLQSLRNQ
jgi:hypothetical protein